MAVKIRLRRMGAHKKPFYRIVVADSRSPRDGRCIEEIGYFNPMVTPVDVKLDMEKVEKWISNGAQPTDRVKSIINEIKNPKEKKEVKKISKRAAKKQAEEAKVKAEAEAKKAEAPEEQSEVKETEAPAEGKAGEKAAE